MCPSKDQLLFQAVANPEKVTSPTLVSGSSGWVSAPVNIPGKYRVPMYLLFPTPSFLSLDAVSVWGWLILCVRGCPVNGKTFSSILGPQMPAAPPPLLTQM